MGAEAERASLVSVSTEEIKRHIAAFRPELNEATLTYRAAVLLLLGPQVRFNIDRLTSRTRYPRAQVAACARRLFDHGLWRPEGPDYRWSGCQDAEFWLDVAVAEGRLHRRVDGSGELEWAEAGTWRKAYDFVTRDASLTIAYVDAPVPAIRDAVETAQVISEKLERPAVAEERVEFAAALAGVAVLEKEPSHARARSTGPKWTRLDGLRRSDLFPDAQWLS